MTTRALCAGLVIACAAHALAADAEPARDVGLTERATSRLAQIDVTVSGPERAIRGLTAAEFEVKLNDKLVPNLIVDDFCPFGVATEQSASSTTETPAVAPSPARPHASTTYLLYFDMAHLTQAGRQSSIDSAREMLPKLMAGGQRAMIVANAAELKTVVPLTSDEPVLAGALKAMSTDRSTFDTYAALEQSRMADVVRTLGLESLDPGKSSQAIALILAHRYASEERWRQERDLRRLSMVLGRFAELDPPKIVLYFADTMRQNAGQHYLSFFSDLVQGNAAPVKPKPEVLSIDFDADTGALPLDRVINDAAGMGIRFYTIEGQGLSAETSPIEARNSASSRPGLNNAPTFVNSQHIRDAQNTLVSLAAETGGRAFLNGVAPKRMASSILGDLSCMYLLSFDPKGFATDNPLAVSVKVKREGVKTAVRGRLVIQSESKRLTGRVLSAFAMPTSRPQASDASLHVGVTPISYSRGKFRARVQVAVGGSALSLTKWEIGASLVSQGAVRQDGSGQIEMTTAAVPVVYEQDMEFAPGEYDLVAVAGESQTDTLLSTEVHGTWPKLEAEPVSIPAIAVSQTHAGGYLRNGTKATQGALVVAEDQPLRGDAPTAVMALVCRAKDEKRPLRAVRTLVGEGETPVGSSDLDLMSERCAQVVDMIRPKTLGPGRYRYVISVRTGSDELAHLERALVVPEVAVSGGAP